MITNLATSVATAGQLAEIYGARWAVEIQFRAWKQSLNLSKALNRKSGFHHMQALVLAAMIVHQLGMKMARGIVDRIGHGRLSYEKLYDLLALRLGMVTDIVEISEFDPDPRHISRDKRSRKSPIESGLETLT